MELTRIQVLEQVLEGLITTRYAALVLGLSERHTYRLKAKLRNQGPEALAHGNRGRKPAHAIPEETRKQVLELAQTKYRGCNYTFLSELLSEYEGIVLSPSSVARILKAAGILSPKKHRPPKLHRLRPRKLQRGMLVHIDGSQHDWLEGRGPKPVLLLAIDDATGEILAGLFWYSEDFEGYRRLLYELVTTHGIPVAVYSDRHTLFFSPKDKEEALGLEEELLGIKRPLTQIGRILSELGIQHIAAHSPQAKGRIERTFGTLQERLVVELRLAGASTIEEANRVLKEFIPRYNEKFAKPPAVAQSAFRPVPSHLRLEHIFCWKDHRRINPGYTVHFEGKVYRVVNPKGAPFIPLRTVVELHKLPGGFLCVAWKGYIYPLEEQKEEKRVFKALEQAKHAPSAKEGVARAHSYKPPADHPWRKPFLPRKVNYTTSLTNSLTSFT